MNQCKTNTSIMNVISSKLLMDAYQRPLDEKRVNAIVKEFNPNLVNYIKCSIRTDGKLYVFDGQHTKAALELRNNNAPVTVRCRIYEFAGLDDSERRNMEAILFAQQNGISKQVGLGDKLKAEYLAGQTKANEFYESSNTSGLKMDFSKTAGNGKIVCLKEAYKAYEALGTLQYSNMLDIIVKSWNMQQESLRREIVGGMALFMKKYGNVYDPERLRTCLSQISPLQIIRDGNLISGSGMGKYVEQIVKIYNKGLTKKFKL